MLLLFKASTDSLNKYLLGAYKVEGTVLVPWARAVTKETKCLIKNVYYLV